MSDTLDHHCKSLSADLADLVQRCGTMPLPRLVEALREDQAGRWRSGARPWAETYLEAFPKLAASAEDALVLVMGEVLLRLELGETPQPREYQARFPQHAETLAVQFELQGHLGSLPQTIGPASPEPRSEAGSALPAVPGYEVLGELGHGGMGVVYLACDPDLRRDLAVKVLLPRHAGQPDVDRRFLAEAQLTGQLQHPGVPPVHEVGTLADGRPFFAMKLVRGQTLAELLRQRQTPAEELPRWLGVFAQVCQAVGYAHSVGVVHRDLKPGNVMVGAFGEVQVMDWGLAKVLAGSSAGESGPSGRGGVVTVRTEAPGSESDGAVMGTLRYMAPEQACGEEVDQRSDVFGLGAILCEILTGQPPYVEEPGRPIYRQAAGGELTKALARLAACGADEDLVRLAGRCLAPQAEDRPRDAGVVAEELTAYLASVQERLRQAELERVAAEARADEARATVAAERLARRRAVQLVLTGAVLVAVVGGAGWWAKRQADQRQAVGAKIQWEFGEWEPKALSLQEAGQYKEAEAVVQRLEGLIQFGAGVPDLADRVAQLRTHLDMLAVIERARLAQAELGADRRNYGLGWAVPLYRVAFQRYGLDVLALSADEAAAAVQASPIRGALLAALADWGALTLDRAEQERLRQVVGAAGPASDEFGRRWQKLVGKEDRDGLARLAGEAGTEGLPAASVVLLSRDLNRLGARAEAVQLLRAAQQREPGDFWLNVELALQLTKAGSAERGEAVPFWRVAVALRPQSPGTHLNLGNALRVQQNLAEAVREYREAIRLDPEYARAHVNLGNVLRAQKDLAGAIQEFREAIRLDPNLTKAHYNLGNALRAQKDPAGAIQEFREAIRLDPGYAEAYCNLGLALRDMGQFGEALSALKRGDALGRRQLNWSYRSQQWVQECQRLLDLDERLPALLRGERTVTADDQLAFARLCLQYKHRSLAAARFYAGAFAEQPALAADLRSGHRYAAACAAALAAAGQGQDAAKLDDKERANLRRQALHWLRADLTASATVLDKNTPPGRAQIQPTLERWQQDPDLASVRGEKELSRLPEAERKAWGQLWADVADLLKRAQQKPPQP
jgi:serine/threonine-protein kinase